MKIVNTEALPEFEYFKIDYPKKQIVLHHTVSAVGKYIDDWFKADKGKSKVAVAYVIDKDGTIFKLFEPEYWAYHIGTGSKPEHNKESIGIEIVNEGPLMMIDDKPRWWIDKNHPRGKYLYKGKPTDLHYTWRNYRWFASYTREQNRALIDLIYKLMVDFNIRRNIVNHFNYDKQYLDYNGIVMHCNLRSDKTDLSPAFNMRLLEGAINLLKGVADIPIRPLEEIPMSLFDVKTIEMKKVIYDVRNAGT